MTAVREVPQSFIVRTECVKATWQNGFRLDLGEVEGWSRFSSATAKGTVALASEGADGPWFLALDHAGVAAELDAERIDAPGPGLARFVFRELKDLYAALSRVYALGVALPDGPLDTFREAVKGLPRTTEAERTTVQRIGQDIFRKSLLAYWRHRCPMTGITEPELLRASHIIPWADCADDAERLDVHNGLLLSALWDAAFDRGLVSFDSGGTPLFARQLSQPALSRLAASAPRLAGLSPLHKPRLAWHREHVFERSGNADR